MLGSGSVFVLTHTMTQGALQLCCQSCLDRISPWALNPSDDAQMIFPLRPLFVLGSQLQQIAGV